MGMSCTHARTVSTCQDSWKLKREREWGWKGSVEFYTRELAEEIHVNGNKWKNLNASIFRGGHYISHLWYSIACYIQSILNTEVLIEETVVSAGEPAVVEDSAGSAAGVFLLGDVWIVGSWNWVTTASRWCRPRWPDQTGRSARLWGTRHPNFTGLRILSNGTERAAKRTGNGTGGRCL